MSEELFEQNPARYRELSEPFKNAEEANKAIQAFYEEVKAARIKHRIKDVHLVMGIGGLNASGTEGEMILSAHIGSEDRQESMLAYAFGVAQAERQQRIAEFLAGSIKKLKKVK